MSTSKDRDSPGAMSGDLQPEKWLTADRVEYIADMVEELKELAHSGGLQTLSGILTLAATEARSQAARLGGQR